MAVNAAGATDVVDAVGVDVAAAVGGVPGAAAAAAAAAAGSAVATAWVAESGWAGGLVAQASSPAHLGPRSRRASCQPRPIFS